MTSHMTYSQNTLLIALPLYLNIISSFFILAALFIVSGMLFPRSISESNTTMASALKPLSFEKSDRNMNSNPVDRVSSESSKVSLESSKVSLDSSKEFKNIRKEKVKSQKQNDFDFWSFLASDSDDHHELENSQQKKDFDFWSFLAPIHDELEKGQDGKPSANEQITVTTTDSPSSKISLKGQIEQNLKNAASQVFADDEIKQSTKSIFVEKSDLYETVDDMFVKRNSAKDSDGNTFDSWASMKFFADDAEIEQGNPQKGEKQSDEIYTEGDKESNHFFAHNPKVNVRVFITD